MRFSVSSMLGVALFPVRFSVGLVGVMFGDGSFVVGAVALIVLGGCWCTVSIRGLLLKMLD